MTKTIHEAGEETAASESVAHLSEPDVEGDLIHAHFERIAHRKSNHVFCFQPQNCRCTRFLVLRQVL